jgi:VCBS repeat-containing protein
LLANDSDPENEAISVLVSSSESVSRLGASVAIQANGEFVYDPRASVTLQALKAGDPAVNDTFAYVVADASGLWTKSTVTVTVTGANSPPVPAPDQFSTVENIVLVVPAAGVLANDTDPDSTSLSTVSQAISSQYGAAIQMRPDGGFTYDPSGSPTLRALQTGQTLADSFAYQVRDDEGATAVGTVTVVVSGFSDPPYQNPANHYDVSGDGSVSPIDPLILINYINANGQGPIPAGRPTPPYLDVNGDGSATAEDVILVVNRLNSFAAGEGESVAEAVYVRSPENVAANAAPLNAWSFSTLSDADAATQFGQPIDGAWDRGSARSDPSPWGSVCTAEAPRLSPALPRSVFDEWDAKASDLEDTLTAISDEADAAEREAATDALIEALFG